MPDPGGSGCSDGNAYSGSGCFGGNGACSGRRVMMLRVLSVGKGSFGSHSGCCGKAGGKFHVSSKVFDGGLWWWRQLR